MTWSQRQHKSLRVYEQLICQKLYIIKQNNSIPNIAIKNKQPSLQEQRIEDKNILHWRLFYIWIAESNNFLEHYHCFYTIQEWVLLNTGMEQNGTEYISINRNIPERAGMTLEWGGMTPLTDFRLFLSAFVVSHNSLRELHVFLPFVTFGTLGSQEKFDRYIRR